MEKEVQKSQNQSSAPYPTSSCPESSQNILVSFGKREKFLVFTYKYTLRRFGDPDLAAEGYFVAEKCIDRLLQNYYTGNDEFFYSLLRGFARNIAYNISREWERQKLLESAALPRIAREFYGLSPSDFCQHEQLLCYANKLRECKKSLRDSLAMQDQRHSVLVHLKYDLPMDLSLLLCLKKLLHAKGIEFETWLAEHRKKRHRLNEAKERLVRKIEEYSFRICRKANDPRIPLWKRRKKELVRKLDNLLSKGLYTYKELSEILGVSKSRISKILESIRENKLAEGRKNRARKKEFRIAA